MTNVLIIALIAYANLQIRKFRLVALSYIFINILGTPFTFTRTLVWSIMAGKKRASSGENGDAPKEKKNKNQTEFSNLDFSTKKCDFKVRTFYRRGRAGGFHTLYCAPTLLRFWALVI